MRRPRVHWRGLDGFRFERWRGQGSDRNRMFLRLGPWLFWWRAPELTDAERFAAAWRESSE